MDAYFKEEDGIQPEIPDWDDSSDEDSYDDDEDEDEVAAPLPLVAAAPARDPLLTKDIKPSYKYEQKDADFRVNPYAGDVDKQWNKVAKTEGAYVSQIRTRYLSPAEQQAHELGFGEATPEQRKQPFGPRAGDRAVRGPSTVPEVPLIGPRRYDRDVRVKSADGKLADTSKASGSAGLAEPGAHTFVMGPDHVMKALDPWKQRREETPWTQALHKPELQQKTDETGEVWYERDAAEVADYKDKKSREVGVSLMNHSSLAAVPNPDLGELPWAKPLTSPDQMVAGKAAGAGELKLSAGHLDQLSDKSGHYEPDNRMTAQVLEEFKEQGVDTYDTTVALAPKPELNQGKATLYASAREFEGAGEKAARMPDAGVNAPQAIMQSRRNRMKWDVRDGAIQLGLRRELKARKERSDAGTMRMTRGFGDHTKTRELQRNARHLDPAADNPFAGRVLDPTAPALDERSAARAERSRAAAALQVQTANRAEAFSHYAQ